VADSQKFARLRAARRVWAVASIHGEAERLDRLHALLAERLHLGDRLVYLGSFLGRGHHIRATVDSLLQFRRALLAEPGMFACDIAYLRGQQEEMWHKLLQLQLAPNPVEVLQWVLDHGTGATLEAYGGRAAEGFAAARGGATAISRWTGSLRTAIREAPGHQSLMTALRRACFTEDGTLLFVHAGLDTSRPLQAQSDSFWWAARRFARIAEPYDGFLRIVRGFDPAHGGVQVTDFTASLDAGCGFGGPLVAACFDTTGAMVDFIEA
jgi:serine/threonine protein phosphatase 1